MLRVRVRLRAGYSLVKIETEMCIIAADLVFIYSVALPLLIKALVETIVFYHLTDIDVS